MVKSKSILILFLLMSVFGFSQKKVSKTFETSSKEINVFTAGLDNLIIENTTSNFIEVILTADSYDEQLIDIKNKTKEVNIRFSFKGAETREVIFRKYITRRLQRANAVIKIPANKIVYIFGENVDVETKSIQNDLAIFIENGIVKLNNIKAKTTLKLYSGNVYATLKNTIVDVKSANGKIKVNDYEKQKEYKKRPKFISNQLTISSIKANLFLTSYKND